MNIRVFRIVYQTIEDFMSNTVVYWSYSVSFIVDYVNSLEL